MAPFTICFSMISKILSDRLQRKIISTDDEVKRKTKLTISRYVKKHGWDNYRDVEANVVDEVCDHDDCIIDAGGGIVLRNDNVVNIKKNGVVFLLTADPKTLSTRVAKRGK